MSSFVAQRLLFIHIWFIERFTWTKNWYKAYWERNRKDQEDPQLNEHFPSSLWEEGARCAKRVGERYGKSKDQWGTSPRIKRFWYEDLLITQRYQRWL